MKQGTVFGGRWMMHKPATTGILTGLLTVLTIFCSETYADQRGELIEAKDRGGHVNKETMAHRAASKPEKKRQLLGAIYRGDQSEVARLLDSGADANANDEFGWTVLMRAVESDRVGVVRLLLDKGAYVKSKTECGWTALMRAVESGSLSIVRLLLDRGADVNARDHGGVTALMDASNHPEVVKLLLDKGADINAKDKGGMTALAWAVNDGKLETAKLLRSRGAEITLPIAVSLRDVPEIRRLIKSGADVNARDRSGSSALIAAVRTGDLELVKLLSDSGARINATEQGAQALRIAESNDSREIVDYLKDRGAQAEESLNTARFPDKVAYRGDEILIRLKDGTIVTRKDTPPTPPDQPDGYTDSSGEVKVSYAFDDFVDPWYVIREQYFEGDGMEFINRDTGTVLKVHGAGPFSPDNARFLSIGYPGESPCNAEIWKLSSERVTREWAFEGSCFYSYRWSDPSTVEVLSHCGGRGSNDLVIARARLEGTSWKCSSAGGISSSEGDAVCSKGGEKTVSKTEEYSPELIKAVQSVNLGNVQLALARGADANEKDHSGRTALMYAAMMGNGDVVKLLLHSGAAAGAKDRDGWTALMLAGSLRNPEIVKLLKERAAESSLSVAASLGDVNAVQQFILDGADLNARDKYGWPPLRRAWANKKWDVAKVLLANGANAGADFRRTALFGAVRDGDTEAIELILSTDIDINEEYGGTPLMAVAPAGRWEVMKLFIKKGADINAWDKYDRTALMAAAIHRHPEAVRLLLQNGSAVDAQDGEGRTALMDGVWGGDRDVVKLLLDKGADVNARTRRGITAMKIALECSHSNLVKLLKAYGAKE